MRTCPHRPKAFGSRDPKAPRQLSDLLAATTPAATDNSTGIEGGGSAERGSTDPMDV
jgi:hypothetical protein